MPRKEIVCMECDMHFTISYKGSEQVCTCPFCGSELYDDDTNDFEDDE